MSSVKCRAKNPAVCRYHGVTANLLVTSQDGKPLAVYAPTVSYHVGSLITPKDKTFSFEGQGLSVSEHPGSWQRIARLSGQVWEIKTPLCFLDYHLLTEPQKDEIKKYGEALGWVERSEVYSTSWWDDEWDQEMMIQSTDREEIEGEAEAYESEVTVSQGWSATNIFPDSTVKAGDNGEDVISKLAVLWVERTKPELHGVWWEDVLDESRLSAPRGVLCVSRVGNLLKHFTAVG